MPSNVSAYKPGGFAKTLRSEAAATNASPQGVPSFVSPASMNRIIQARLSGIVAPLKGIAGLEHCVAVNCAAKHTDRVVAFVGRDAVAG